MRDIIITATADVSQLFNAMRAAGRSVSDMASQVERSGGAAAKSTDTFVSRMLGRINNLSGNVIGGAVAGVTATATAALGGMVAQGFDAAKSAVIDFNSTLQNADIGFTTMLGSGQKSKQFLDQLQSFAKATPFEFKGLVQNAQTLMGMGVKAKDVIPSLTALGDSTASVGGGMDTLNSTILAFAQMNAKGKLSMDNMYQLMQGGMPSALKVLAAQYGVSTGKMMDMISSGKVMSDDALPKLISGIEKGTKSTAALGGMMDKQSQTFTGAMSNISDGATQLLAKAFKPLFDQASKGAQALATLLGSKQMTAWGDKLNGVLKGVIKAFGGLPSIADMVKVLPGVLDAIVKRATPVVKGIASAFQTYGPIVGKQLQSIASSTKPVIDSVMNLAPLIPPLAKQLGELAATVGGSLAGAWGVLAPIVSGAVDVLGKILGPILKMPGAITLIVGAIVAWKLATMGMAAVNAVIQGYTAFTYGAQGATYAAGTAAKVYAVLTNGVGIATKIAAAGQWLLNAAMDANPIGIVVVALTALVAGLVWFFTQTKTGQKIWGDFVGFLSSAWQGFTGWISGALKNIGAWFAQWGGVVLAIVAPVIGLPLLIIQNWGKITAFFSGVGKAVIGALSNAWNWLVETGTNALKGLLDGAVKGLQAFGAWERSIGRTIIGWLVGAGKWLVDTGHDVLQGMLDGAVKGLQALGAWERGIGRSVIGWLAGAGKWLFDTGSDLLGGMLDGAVKGFLALGAWERGIGRSIIGWVAGAGSWLISAGTSVLHGMATGAATGFAAVKSFVGGIPGKVRAAIGDAGSILLSVGRNIIGGLVSGISNAAGGVMTKVHEVINAIPAAARKLLGIASPSKVFRQIGMFVGQGLIKGLDGTQDQVKTAMGSLVDKVKTAFNALADQREASQKRLKKLDQQLGDVDATTKAGKKRAAVLRGEIADEKSLYAQLEKAGSAKKSGLVQRLQQDTNALSALAKQRDSLGDQLKTAQDDLDKAISTRNDFGASVASDAIGGGNVVDQFSKAIDDASNAADKATDLASKISDLDDSVSSSADDRQTILDKIANSMSLSESAKTAAGKTAALNQVATLTNQLGDLDKKVAGYQKDRASLVDQMTAAQATADQSPVGLMVKNLQDQVAKTNQFNALLKQLKSKGLDDTTYSQLVAGGVDNGLSTAQALAADGTGAVGAIAALQGQLNQAASQLGSSTSTQLYQAGVDEMQAHVNGLQSQIVAVTGAMGVVQADVATAVAKLGVNTSGLMRDAGRQIASALGEGVTATQLEKAVAKVEVNANQSAKKLASATSKAMKDAGGDIMDGLAAGLKGKTGDIDDVMDGLSAKMLRTLKKRLGIKSPSTVFRDEVGVMIPRGVAAGIDRGARDLDASLTGMIAIPKVKDAMAGSWSASGASGAQGGGQGATVHNEFTIEVPAGADRDDTEYAENLLGQVRFAVGATTGTVQ